MKKPKYRIVVMTSDNYLGALKPFAYLLKKYWENPPEVVVFGFKKPDFSLPGFQFMSIGDQKDFPINRWSDQLIIGLQSIPDKVFILMLEDMWIVRQVYSRVVDMAFDYMEQFKYVARFDLTGDRWNAFDSQGRRPPLYGKLGHVDIVWSNPGSQYHLSTMPAFWRKDHLLRALVPGETPWQVELQGTPRLSMMGNEVIVLGTNAWPIKNTLAFRGGTTSKLLLDEIDPLDVETMRAAGLFKGLE